MAIGVSDYVVQESRVRLGLVRRAPTQKEIGRKLEVNGVAVSVGRVFLSLTWTICRRRDPLPSILANSRSLLWRAVRRHNRR